MKRVAEILAAATLLALAANPTAAHVVLQNGTAAPGSFYKAVLNVPHGCAGSATIKLRVQIPEGLIAVKPMAKPGWAIEVTKGKYERTYSYIHGMTVAEGAKEIAWTGRLEDAFVDEFAFAAFVTDTLKPGDLLALPTVQECDKGSERWVEIAAAGQSPHSLKAPAPLLKIAGPVEGAGKFEIHEMSMDNNVMRMRQLPAGLEIKPGETVELKPGGYHGMAMNLTRGFTAGQSVPGTLKFEKAGDLAVVYAVGPLGGAMAPAVHRH